MGVMRAAAERDHAERDVQPGAAPAWGPLGRMAAQALWEVTAPALLLFVGACESLEGWQEGLGSQRKSCWCRVLASAPPCWAQEAPCHWVPRVPGHASCGWLMMFCPHSCLIALLPLVGVVLVPQFPAQWNGSIA